MAELLSTSQAAELLGVSRITVFNQIKAGKIPAKKIGGIYLIDRADLALPGEKAISDTQKSFIEESVDKVISDYDETLKLLKDA